MTTEISNWWNVNGATSSAAAARGSVAATLPNDELSKETFLQLLVAQIRHQDPLNPSDGIQFLTELAQFSELEQLMNMSQDVSAIRTGLEQPAASGDSGATGGDASQEPAG